MVRCARQGRACLTQSPPGVWRSSAAFHRDDVSPTQLRARKAVPLHHVGEEELQAGPVPQLEARGHRGALHVRHPAEQPRALHRPGGTCSGPIRDTMCELSRDRLRFRKQQARFGGGGPPALSVLPCVRNVDAEIPTPLSVCRRPSPTQTSPEGCERSERCSPPGQPLLREAGCQAPLGRQRLGSPRGGARLGGVSLVHLPLAACTQSRLPADSSPDLGLSKPFLRRPPRAGPPTARHAPAPPGPDACESHVQSCPLCEHSILLWGTANCREGSCPVIFLSSLGGPQPPS